MKRIASSTALLVLALALLLGAPWGASAEDASWFTNVAGEVGLEGVRGKAGCFVDLDGDGYWDLVVDRQHVFRNEEGKRFVADAFEGLPFPTVKRVPFDRKTGLPAPDRAKEGTFVPRYLYFADVDNDGAVDALAGVHWADFVRFVDGAVKRYEACDHGQRTQVFLGDGKGGFVAGPASAYTADEALGPRMALACVDVDADGVLDLFEGREYLHYGVMLDAGVDRLWLGDGQGGFRDGTKAAGLETVRTPAQPNSSRPTYGVTSADLDNDGWPDLLQMAYGRQWNYQWRSRGDGTFEDVGRVTTFAGDGVAHGHYPPPVKRRKEAPFRANGNTFDCAVGDIDNDGDLDCFLGEIAHWWAGSSSDRSSLLINQGPDKEFAFERIPVQDLLARRPVRGDGIRWNEGDLHVAFADFDNDTRLDLLIGSGDYPDGQFLRLYHQQPDGSFAEVTKLAGFDWEGCGGLSLGDFDRDGDVDIFAGRSFQRLNKAHRDKFMGGIEINEPALFRNEIAGRTGNHWINIQLKGKGKGGCNRMGVGARIRVVTGDVKQIREIRIGSGLSGHQDAPEAHFGLGKATVIDRIEVHWKPGAAPHVLEKVEVDRHLVIEEPDA